MDSVQYLNINFCITHVLNPSKSSSNVTVVFWCALRLEILVDFGTAAIIAQQKLWDFGGYGTVSSQNNVQG